MSRIRVAPIVEGHGEQASAIRTLLFRIWTELLDGEFIDVLRPIRIPRTKLVRPSELIRAIDLATLKLTATDSPDRSFILVLFDADDDCPGQLSSALRETIFENRRHIDVSLVIANVEFETWFAAAAESLSAYFDLSRAVISVDPEASRQGKGIVQKWMAGRYSETIDQPRLTSAFDLKQCRARSRSFDKLCRELESRQSL